MYKYKAERVYAASGIVLNDGRAAKTKANKIHKKSVAPN